MQQIAAPNYRGAIYCCWEERLNRHNDGHDHQKPGAGEHGSGAGKHNIGNRVIGAVFAIGRWFRLKL